tara:strand:- start:12845 stop:13288 length:444 start_codon:yes stop_codon:yes gene_type:complete
MDKRYMVIVLGQYEGINYDFNNIANEDYGLHYVDGNGIFMGTFYSDYSVDEIHELLVHVPAILLFDITDKSKSAINLPSQYFKGLFPEYENTLDVLEKTVKNKKGGRSKSKIEEYDNINDILDKLSRNEYDRTCLTEKEIEILEKSS